ncbi:ethanolamine utilization phosphate acetyltransferase EutD [Isobaculum melis]|uniref:Phosphate propanoyltransferase n=1 Tax=Isobaculum melis TaxID=142588 RepID=A0A1H9U483_9LACT|nr:ethanolamine utilization phosphate acetyltransferase EutD [Isobaculum melis]SES04370.1 Propanediol utilization protein [Isobaculum melis]
MNPEDLNCLIEEVVKRVENQNGIEVEASGRHIHLDRATIDALFGKGYELRVAKYLSQPGQFASKERVTLVGSKGVLHNVIVLGPERSQSQAEISATDALAIGVKAPVRESGDIAGTPGILVMNGGKSVQLSEGLIVAKRHIHMTVEDAAKANVKQGEIVQVKVNAGRPLIFDDVVIRVSPNFATVMHIDYDEANACGWSKGTRAQIMKKSSAL